MRIPIIRNLPIAAAVLLLLQLTITPAASAEKRVALVIGQSAYRAVPALPNPANDAQKMTELLSSAGFDVTSAANLSQDEMRQAVSNFGSKVSASGPDTVAMVFYAGHGLQIDGENYLVPVDIDPKREADVPLQAMRLNDVLNTLGGLPTRMRIIMLDACRNNPFPEINASTGHGLAIVDTKAGAAGTFISFSTSPGSVAEDGSGDNSPYTTALLSVARQPNLTIEEAFKRVRVAVNQSTSGRQIPWESSSLTSDFKFFTGAQAPAAEAQPAKPPEPAQVETRKPATTRSVDDWRRELKGKDPRVAYDLVIADDTVEAYEAYVGLFSDPSLKMRARLLLDRRHLMEKWATAVAINSAASYQAFLASYPDSDLTVTARKLLERVRNRAFGSQALAALEPVCSCTPTQPIRKRLEEQPAPKSKKVDRRRSSTEVAPPAQQEIPPEAIIGGIGAGLAIGGALRHRGGNVRPQPQSQPHLERGRRW